MAALPEAKQGIREGKKKTKKKQVRTPLQQRSRSPPRFKRRHLKTNAPSEGFQRCVNHGSSGEVQRCVSSPHAELYMRRISVQPGPDAPAP